MNGAWILTTKTDSKDRVCSSLPVVFALAPKLKPHSSRIYKNGGMENDDYVLKRCAMYRPQDVR